MKTGGLGEKARNFLNHKSFHPGSYKNLLALEALEQETEKHLQKQKIMSLITQDKQVNQQKYTMKVKRVKKMNTYMILNQIKND